MTEKLPLKIKEEELHNKQGTEHLTHVFIGEDGREYIRKRFKDEVMWRSDFLDRKISEDEMADTAKMNDELKDIASVKNRIHQILKKHFGDRLVDASYVISEGDGKRSVLDMIQRRVEGVRADEAVVAGYIDPDKLQGEMNRIEREIKDLWNNNRSFSKIPGAIRSYNDMHSERNVMVTPEG